MKRKYLIGGIAAAVLLVGGGVGIAIANTGGQGGSAYGAGPTSGSGTPAGVGLKTASLEPGTALVDSAGQTLYLFEADSPTKSACDGGCTQVWPPLLEQGNQVTLSGAVQQDLVGSVARADGTRQVTYDGHPLYTYVGDTHSGNSAGQGLNQFGADWYVVAPSGDKIDDDD
jgi:predicted lipoprotein with Yx(FWY)xxD motif